ncbi:hypothetical protein ACSL103130_02270 [Actinomyces slackii]|uniref:Transcriptional regulator, AbiEi antitoxin, Type IV TA system n=1 Tax=Actinomyces slackii TaxID=52774 RepID=A0A3S5EM59_9ACTO|nr:hypothetical protein [Actinomyces slackii]VEG74415.1 Uncharacterised protein [Actinomyces slackii]
MSSNCQIRSVPPGEGEQAFRAGPPSQGQALPLLLSSDSQTNASQHLSRAPGLTRISSGVYVPTERWAQATHQDRHLARIRAAQEVCGGDLVLMGASAALWQGIGVVGPIPDQVQCVGERGDRRGTSGLRRHERAGLGDLIEVGGILTTSAADTAVDLARCGGLVQGVCAMDSALAQGRVTGEAIEDAVERLGRGARGVRCARTAAHLADGRSESPGESLSRVRMWQAGLPRPELQYEVCIDGRIYRFDFFWARPRVDGEFDGRKKYRRESFGKNAEQTVWEERQRERAIIRAGIEVSRWTWDQAWRHEGAAMIEELARCGVHPTGQRW